VLERNQNKNNINTLLITLNLRMDNIKSIAHDYGGWDDTYYFIEGKNSNYIYDNFREGTDTLENLNLDFMIFSNLKDNIAFSQYTRDILKKNRVEFEKELLKKFDSGNIVNTMYKFKTNYLFLSKTRILKSDFSGMPNGYIYAGKIINNKSLNLMIDAFKKLYISDKSFTQNDLKFNYSYLENVKVKIITKDENIINYIQFYDRKDNYIFSIVCENERNIVKNGQKTILMYNLIISMFLFVLFYILFKNQKILERYNELLETKVDNKTAELRKTLKVLEVKNEELDRLANTDSLTNIRNRRSFFIESNRVLQKSILENSELFIVSIDLDYFKKINDTYGHLAGDKVLIEFCNIVNSIIDDDTIFGRIGGEEFCITFLNKDIKSAVSIVECIRHKCETTVVEIEDKKIKFTISMGLTERENAINVDDILRNSDSLLYKAKESGRNRLFRASSR
jgi:diguanylate cyclase (GGDEF)-like protein